MNFRKETPNQQTGFQMAPMIDIMFLLLIFFMAAAIYAQWETKMDVTVPTASTGVRADRQAGEVIVNIDPDGTVVVNNFTLDLEMLEERLTQVAQLHPDQAIIIRADRTTAHEKVMGVLDTCRQAGIWNIAFASLPEKADTAE